MPRIYNAHDAWWFLYDHPRFVLPALGQVVYDQVGNSVKPKEPHLAFRTLGPVIYYPFLRHPHRAIETNLSIHYTKVDDTGTVNDVREKNRNVECWLEFGEYAYSTSSVENRLNGMPDHHKPHRFSFHDVKLDVGAPTFDEALVLLARRVKKLYGDYDVQKKTTGLGGL